MAKIDENAYRALQELGALEDKIRRRIKKRGGPKRVGVGGQAKLKAKKQDVARRFKRKAWDYAYRPRRNKTGLVRVQSGARGRLTSIKMETRRMSEREYIKYLKRKTNTTSI